MNNVEDLQEFLQEFNVNKDNVEEFNDNVEGLR